MSNLMNKKRFAVALSFIMIFSLLLSTADCYAVTVPKKIYTHTAAAKYVCKKIMNITPEIAVKVKPGSYSDKKTFSVMDNNIFKDDADNFSLLGDFIENSIFDGYSCSSTTTKYTGSKKSKSNRLLKYEIDYRVTRAQNNQFNQALDTLISEEGFMDMEYLDRLYAIYNYVCDNVTYDNSGEESGVYKHTAHAALLNHTAVCQGYSSLLYILYKKCEIPVRIISGTCDDGEEHSWNIVRIGDFFYNVDATWDSCYRHDGDEPESWFLLSDASFEDHNRDAAFATESFYENHPMAEIDFTEKYGHITEFDLENEAA